MANRPIQTSLPANLPTNWTQNQIVAPNGSDVGQSTEYGYNYLNRQINDAQTAVNTINAAFDNVAATDTPAPAYGVCSTAASTAAKAVTVTGSAATFSLFIGVSVRVLFSNENTANTPTLNVNNTGAIPIQSRSGTAAKSGAWDAGEALDLVYTGTSWIIAGGNSRLPSGAIIMWSGTTSNIPTGFALCNGNNGTPDLRNRFIVGAGSTYTAGATGGATTHTHTYSGKTDYGTNYPSVYRGTETTANGAHDHTYSGTTSTGSSLPPYYALCFIMKL